MSEKAFNEITPEEIQQMIDRDIVGSKSIYAPSGSPDHRLKPLFMTVSSGERTVQMVSSERIMIDVTFILDLSLLKDMNPEMRRSMTAVLLHDGHRRLALGKIRVDESSYQDNPARLVYSCDKASKSKIRKFIDAWNKA